MLVNVISMKSVRTLLKLSALALLVSGSASLAHAGYGAGACLNQPGAPGFGRIACVGGYRTSWDAIQAAVRATGASSGAHYAAGAWSARGYGVTARGFNSTHTYVVPTWGGGFATSAAAITAAKNSLPLNYRYNIATVVAYNP